MKKPFLHYPTPSKGQIFSEYGVTLALVSIFSIASLILFQDQIVGMFTGFKLVDTNTVAATGLPSLGPATSGSNTGLNTGLSTGVTDGTIPMMVRLSDGTVIELGNYPVNLAKAVETAGVNGTTDQLLATLEAFTAKLAAEGKLTPEQVSAYNRLANLGHDLADAEKVIEDTMNSCGTDATCLQTKPVVFKGQTYPNLVAFETNNIGFWETCESATSCSVPTPTSQSLLTDGITTEGWYGFSKNFADEYADIKSKGLLSNPDLNTVVTALSSQILMMSDVLESTTGKTAVNDNPAFTPENYKQNMISGITDVDSTGICAVGGGTDSGVKCQ